MTSPPPAWPRGNGEMVTLVRAHAWSSTPLGALGMWPPILRALAELMLSSPQPVCIAWGEALTCLFNDAYAQLLGEGHPRALGLPLPELWAERWSELRPSVDDALAGHEQLVELAPLAAGPGATPAESATISLAPLFGEGATVLGLYCVALRAPERLHEAAPSRRDRSLPTSDDRYRTVFAAIDEGFCIVELLFDEEGRARDYRFLEANDAFERHSGLRGVVGRTMREFAPEHEEWWFEVYGRVALTGEPTRFENRAAHLDDRWFDVFALRVGAPEARHVAVVFNDISARKRAERALQEANRRKDEFLATLAHELRNPLAPLRTGLELVRARAPVAHDLHRTLDRMDRQLSHLVRLVDDLLDVGRISTGKLQLQTRPLTLRAVLAGSIESTAELIAKKSLELTLEGADEDLHVVGDFDRLAQVFINLLSNAAKYTPAGGNVRVVSYRDGDEVVVDVIDTGIGIPPSELEEVFELFSQVRAHQGLTGGGLGIGLALVKSLVALHAGRVEVHSAGPGLGSRFSVRLPAAPASELAELPAAAPPSSAAPARRRILVADDNVDGATLLAELFALSGHEVWIAHDGLEAIEKAAQLEPDVILLDLGMPRLDGYEAARRIRATPAGRHLLLVALTGWGQAEDRRRTREAGFDQHLVKPVDHHALLELLKVDGSAGPAPTPR